MTALLRRVSSLISISSPTSPTSPSNPMKPAGSGARGASFARSLKAAARGTSKLGAGKDLTQQDKDRLWGREGRRRFLEGRCLAELPEEDEALELLEEALRDVSLPPPWALDESEDGTICFFNRETKKASPEHPLEGTLRELVGFWRICSSMPVESHGPYLDALQKSWARDAGLELSVWECKTDTVGGTYNQHKRTKRIIRYPPADVLVPAQIMRSRTKKFLLKRAEEAMSATPATVAAAAVETRPIPELPRESSLRRNQVVACDEMLASLEQSIRDQQEIHGRLQGQYRHLEQVLAGAEVEVEAEAEVEVERPRAQTEGTLPRDSPALAAAVAASGRRLRPASAVASSGRRGGGDRRRPASACGRPPAAAGERAFPPPPPLPPLPSVESVARGQALIESIEAGGGGGGVQRLPSSGNGRASAATPLTASLEAAMAAGDVALPRSLQGTPKATSGAALAAAPRASAPRAAKLPAKAVRRPPLISTTSTATFGSSPSSPSASPMMSSRSGVSSTSPLHPAAASASLGATPLATPDGSPSRTPVRHPVAASASLGAMPLATPLATPDASPSRTRLGAASATPVATPPLTPGVNSLVAPTVLLAAARPAAGDDWHETDSKSEVWDAGSVAPSTLPSPKSLAASLHPEAGSRCSSKNMMSERSVASAASESTASPRSAKAAPTQPDALGELGHQAWMAEMLQPLDPTLRLDPMSSPSRRMVILEPPAGRAHAPGAAGGVPGPRRGAGGRQGGTRGSWRTGKSLAGSTPDLRRSCEARRAKELRDTARLYREAFDGRPGLVPAPTDWQHGLLRRHFMGGFYGLGCDLEIETEYRKERGRDSEPLYVHDASTIRIWRRALELVGTHSNNVALLFATVNADCFYSIARAVVNNPVEVFDELAWGHGVRRNAAVVLASSLEPSQLPRSAMLEAEEQSPSFYVPLLVPFQWCQPAPTAAGERMTNYMWAIQVPGVAVAARTAVAQLGKRMSGEVRTRRSLLRREF